MSTPSPAEDEIDLLALAKTLWSNKKLLITITLSCSILGLFIALLSPKEFTATSIFIPQTAESGKGGSLGGLASLAGINLNAGGGGSEIPPSLYPKIVSSVTFKKALLQASFKVEGRKESVTYQKFYEEIYAPGLLSTLKKYTLGLPGLLIAALKSEPTAIEMLPGQDRQLYSITLEEYEHFKRLENQLSVQPNEKEGFVTLSFVMPEALMAAEMTKFAEELLQKEIIQFKIQNAKEQLKFTEERYKEKKKEFEEAHARLAYFRDRNQNIASAAVMNQQQKLEAEYNFAFNIYNELAKQLEQAKLQVSKDTPVLSVIQPVTIPTEKSGPKRPLILVIFTILGGIISIAYIFGKEFFKGIKEQWSA